MGMMAKKTSVLIFNDQNPNLKRKDQVICSLHGISLISHITWLYSRPKGVRSIYPLWSELKYSKSHFHLSIIT